MTLSFFEPGLPGMQPDSIILDDIQEIVQDSREVQAMRGNCTYCVAKVEPRNGLVSYVIHEEVYAAMFGVATPDKPMRRVYYGIKVLD